MGVFNLSKNKSELSIFLLLFGLLAVFLVHNFDSIGQDIGRHLKVGEIIWQTKEVPKTNLFSFTEPDFPFSNHHWLSEVIFYGVYNLGGFTGLILLKISMVLASFLLLFYSIKPLWITDTSSRLSIGSHRLQSLPFWPIVISFLLSIFIFISRTEVRPEIFSFLILAFFLFVLFRAKYSLTTSTTSDVRGTSAVGNYRLLWFLPLAQLFWVNLHIYFFIGPLIFTFFLIDQAAGKNKFSIFNFQFSKFLIVGGLTVSATLINPAGIQGALLPLNILKEYGYSIVENQTLAFLSGFFGFNLSVFVFKFSVATLAISFLLTVKKTTHSIGSGLRQKMFEILMLTFFTYAGFKMFRNLPLYAIASFPVSVILLMDVQNKLTTYNRRPTTNDRSSASEKRSRTSGRIANNIFKTTVVGFLIFMTFFVMSGGYYRKTNSSKAVGFSVPNGLERAVNFVKENKIEGPMFNNFDTGGYLIWKLYPGYKIFVDNRPEAYSVKFFNEIYKPMQTNKEKWAEFSDKYDINFIFFAYSDATPWGETFLGNIVKNHDWRIVYINEVAIILVKNNKSNKEVISNFFISETDAIDRTVKNVKDSNTDKVNLNITLSLLFYKINWSKVSIYFADEAIKLSPQTPRPYLFKGFVYARSTDLEGQKLAGENIKKAIELGLKESQYYYILGVVYMNLGRLDEARLLFEKALELDKNNTQAKEFLQKYF